MGFGNPTSGFSVPRPAVSQVILSSSITASGSQATLAAVQTTMDVPTGGTLITYAGELTAPAGSAAALDNAAIRNPTFTPDVPGIYTVAITATDTESGATLTLVRTQEVVSELSIALTADSSQDTLDAVSTTTTPTGGLGAIAYATTLLLPDRTSGAVSGGTTTTPSFTPTIAGLYVLTVTATDAAGQTATASRKVLVGTAALSVSITAIGNNASLPTSGTEALACSASGAVGSVTYAWTVTDPSGASVTPADATAASTTIAYTSSQQPGQWTAIVTVTDAAGRTARAAELWTTGGLPTSTTPRSILIYVSGGAPLWKEQVLIGSHWVDVAGSSGSLTTETDGGVTFSGTTMTIPDALAASSTGQGCPDERYVAFSSASAALQALIATGAQLKLTFDQTSIANNDFARWGGAITSAAGSFDTAGENIIGARFGWETSAYRMQIAAASGGYNNATTSASLGPVQFGSQVGTANTGRVYWAAATYGSNLSGGTTTPTRLYLLGSAQTSPTSGTTAIVNPTIRAAFYPATL